MKTYIKCKLALNNAEAMYRCLCQNSKVLENYPIQFIPVTEFPKWVKPEHQQEPCIILMEETSKNAVCLIVYSSNMLETIDNMKCGKKRPVGYLVPSISNCLGCRICTSVSEKKLVKIYEHALLISQELHISLPVVLIVDKEQIGCAAKYAKLRYNDGTVGDIIQIAHSGKIEMIHSLAHELRHCWQEYNSSEDFFKEYKLGLPYKDYNSQIEEIDAEAFACNYINKLGYDGMQFTFHEVFDHDLYNAVKTRINEIKESSTP